MEVETITKVNTTITLEDAEPMLLARLLRLAFTIIPENVEEEAFALKLFNAMTADLPQCPSVYQGCLEDDVVTYLRDRECAIESGDNEATEALGNAVIDTLRKGL